MQNNDLLQQLSSLSSDAQRALLTRLMQAQSERTERWEALSYNQQALWFHANLAPDSAAYNLLYSVRIFEAMDNAMLQQACQQLARRYPILTATFAVHNEKPAQHIIGQQEIPIQEVDAMAWDSDTLQQEIVTMSNQTIDLAQGPLFRVVLFRDSSHETILAFIAHHIIVDFWAFNILIDELFTLYNAAKTHSTVALPPLMGQHNDYVQWQQALLASATGEQHWHYWQETLSAPLPVLHLPTDHPRPPVQTYHGSSFDLTLPQTLTHRLRALASQEKVTPFTLLLAGYQTLIFRYTNQNDILIGTPTLGRNEATFERLIDDVTNPVMIRARLTTGHSFLQLLRQTQQNTFDALEHQDYPFPLLVERLQPERNLSYPPLYQTAFTWDKPRRRTGATLAFETFMYGQQGTLFDLALSIFELDNELVAGFRYNTDLFESETIERLANHFLVLLEAIVAQPDQLIRHLPLLTQQEQLQTVLDRNRTDTPPSHARSIQQLIAEQAHSTPDALALVCTETALTYRDLNERANQLAHYLRREGIGPDISVGVCLERSSELIIILLAILKAGGSYIPLDPHYPVERIAWMLHDAQPAMVITQKQLRARISTQDHRICCIEDIWSEFAIEATSNPTEITGDQHTAYIIYTSGSTGRPKGVMISHHNVLNFFVGMDATLHEADTTAYKTWLAVTSISFDISVLELFWTLSRGFQVVLQTENIATIPIHHTEQAQAQQVPTKDIEFSLFYFANAAYEEAAEAGYKLLLEGAQFADQHGFTAVWTPERHFHEFGGLYPNPSVISAALATLTQHIHIRAGSIVLPLHHPVRVAEEWALVDQLSHGRTGVAFASGWHANDFAFAPEKYAQRKAILARDIETVRALWRGESVTVQNGTGDSVAIRTFPRPIQAELPVWITSSGNRETFQLAGASGANILTHLLGQNLNELAQKIAAYHEAWHQHGHDAQGQQGHVTLMVHTFIGTDLQTVHDTVRVPFSNYLRSSAELMKSLAQGLGQDINQVTEDDMNALVAQAFDRYVGTSGLMGTVESCLPIVEQIKALGVDEIACLIDFGVAADDVLGSLQHLAALKEQSNYLPIQSQYEELSVSQQLIKSGASYLQCTPSLMNMLLLLPETADALRNVRHLLLGGEALPLALIKKLQKLTSATLHNMYGPTETTIWSSTAQLPPDISRIDLGQPIANTQIYILDDELQPVPTGVTGELYISGDGVARGYLNQPALTAERFLPNPWSTNGQARMYRTGDLARYLANGTLEYLGRSDQQVKLHGFRIELGEIETVLQAHPMLQEAIVAVHTTGETDPYLVAYVVIRAGTQLETATLQAYLRTRVPNYMVPALFLSLPTLPKTPNGKIDRQALPAPENAQALSSTTFVAPTTQLQLQLAEQWAQTLHLTNVGITDNFFKLGGHSLAAVEITTHIRDTFQVVISLRDFFEMPTITALAQRIEQERALTQNEDIHAALLIQPQKRDTDTFLLSFGQLRLWLLNQLEPEDVSYLLPIAIQLNGKLHIQALIQSLNSVIQRHELLRTVFTTDHDEPVQRILPHLTLPINVVDLSTLPPQARQHTLATLSQQESRLPFDLEQGPLLRAHLLRINKQEHILLFTMHHIISDGQKSADILMQELSIYYRARLTGQSATLPALPIQYADYSVWQRQQLHATLLEKQLSYWRQQLAGSPTLLELPTDYPRPAIQTSVGAREVIVFPRLLTQQLQAFSQHYNGTLFITLLAAFQVLLMRYSRQQDIAIGTPSTNRGVAELQGLIGFFVNTLVIRTNPGNNPSFLQLVTQVKETVLQAYENQDIPFEQLVDALEVERSLSYTPLFQVLFAQQNTADARLQLDLPDITWTRLNLASTTTKFDLSVMITEQAEGVLVEFEYSTALFRAETIRRMLGHWQVLLAAIVEKPDQKIAELPLLTPDERERLLVPWNTTNSSQTAFLSFHERFEQQVEDTPDAIALVFEEHTLTYRELDQRTNQLARWLRTQGIGPERLVGVYQERSVEMVVTLLAIVKAGGAYVPLDPEYPEERINWIVQQAELTLLLTQTRLAQRNIRCSCEVICLDNEYLHWTLESSEQLNNISLPEHLAYVIYTSGSTGRPKGVTISRRGIDNFLQAMSTQPGMTARDRLLAVATIAFDIAGMDLFLPLWVGATVIVSAQEVSRDAHLLAQLLAEQAITIMQATPATWHLLLMTGWQGSPQLKILCGGEAFTQRLAQQLETRSASMWNVYGPTETTVWSTVHRIKDVRTETTISIGHPIGGMQTFILDASQNPVPIGVAGELYMGGVGLGRGYLHRGDLTAERYVPHPWSNNPGARLYRTGDLARYLPDGSLEYLGRIDQQVKVRGYRIELGEIEAALGAHPAVQECVVLAREDVPGDKRLVAYVIAQPGEALTINDLRTSLQERLPGYMLPAAFVFLDTIPLTPNGKVDRRALPAPEHLRPELAETFVAPGNEIETTLARIWSHLLRIERVGVRDNFFALGGDSILSIQVVARAREAGLHLTPRQLFQYQTIEQLATILAIQTNNLPELAYQQAEITAEIALSDFPLAQLTQETIDQLAIEPGQLSDMYPLSAVQEGMLFHSLYAQTAGVYIEQFSCLITGQLEQELFAQAWQHIAMQHAALRTTFRWEDVDEPYQIVWSQISLPIESHDWQHYTPQQQQNLLETFLSDDRARNFDLQQAPLMRLTLLRLDGETTRMIWTYHHLLLDGWSLPLILQGVFDQYISLRQTKTPHDVSRRPYRDYIAWLRQQDGKTAEAYWRQQLAGFEAATLLEIAPAVSTQISSSEPLSKQSYQHIQRHLSRAQTALWRQQTRRQQLTLNTLFQGAWSILLARYSHQRDVLFGNVVSGRPPTLAGVEQMVGLFINTVPVRIQIPDQLNAIDWLHQVQAQQAEQHQYEVSSLIEIQGWSEIPRNRPFFESLLAFENYPLDVTSLGQQSELTITEVSLAEQTNYPLALMVTGTSELTLQITYDHQRFATDAMQRLMDHLIGIIEQFVHTPELPLTQISLLTAEERRQQLYAWNDTDRTFATNICLHQHIEQQMRRQPDSIAVRFEESQISYQELDAQANHLAARLQQHKIGPDTLVGVCMERSLDLVIALLAILKTGGAYVPLDPTYPQERLNYMLIDAQVSLVITQEQFHTRLQTAVTTPEIIDFKASAFTTSAHPPHVHISPDNLAYMIYTSGSTGKPKGVMNSHRGLCNRLFWMQEAYQLTAQDRVLQKTPFSFDVSVWEFFWPLLAGASLVVARPGGHQDPTYLKSLILEQDISTLHFVPPMLQAFLQEPELTACTSLRRIICSGEALLPDLQAHFFTIFSAQAQTQVQLYNLYGPTEAAIDVTHWTCQSTATSVPIGHPIANTQIYLLDPDLHPVPIGVTGEIYIGGTNLARGYFQRSELTAEKFLPNPFSNEPGTRLYRTGDLARQHGDGAIDYLGRLDHQIKLRGFRIELGEIEAQLREHTEIKDALVLLYEDVVGPALIAYVVPHTTLTASTEQLRAYLRHFLPDYMLPSTIMTLAAFPLTGHGKIDRGALPHPDRYQQATKATFVPPQTLMQQQLAEIWSQLLQLPQISLHDDFFELGGHSLLITKLATRIRSTFEVKVPLRDLFEAPTLAKMASCIEQIQNELIMQADDDKLMQILAALDGESDDDLQLLLEDSEE
ncbi:non-ribosomal peptide synthetase [Dictyobacter arantiisoli]|uniref:Carrier domain-containing protein n=1 Tax=Dictyobacter arantiisoli TaxID=2014874 RepID=A0A5A5TF87_9CHLR|nr:non-ribosomal peptide synthetase [Dictyobacter arantiisoli]GCF10241.1 hypothetical protein KDI_38050 [Dictyobacter arantiisoli]